MRKARRIAVEKPARLHPNQWSSLEVRLLDLSETGFRVECDAKVIVGLPVRLEIDGVGEVEALVSWKRGGEFGARFLKPVDLQSWGIAEAEETVLAQLLVKRAAATQAGRLLEERELRRQILAGLPMIRLDAAGA